MFLAFLSLSRAEQEFGGSLSSFYVGYYTMIKLQHDATKLFLSSARLNYVNGSHQQITYGTKRGILAETFWTVFPLPNETEIGQGESIQCGSAIRLNHATTGKFLHSHQIEGPFGRGYEVSAFDEDDTGNYWVVECDDMWTAATAVRMKHFDTKLYLSASVKSSYPQDMGDGYEVFADDVPENNDWYIQGGIFVNNGEE